MNRPKLWISFLALLIVISVGTYFQPERRVMRFYNRNIDEMKSIIDGSDEQLKSLEILNDITVRRWSGEHEIIQFDVTGAGIVPTSKYYGFFYCKDNGLVPFSCSFEHYYDYNSSEDTYTAKRYEFIDFYPEDVDLPEPGTLFIRSQ